MALRFAENPELVYIHPVSSGVLPCLGIFLNTDFLIIHGIYVLLIYNKYTEK
jgi:hypothetical protein